MNSRRYAITLLAALCMLRPAPGQTQITLNVGDVAPPLQVAEWLNGDPVKSFEKGKVYVVECWATWCGPCIRAIPHVSALNTKLKSKGVVFIGMNVWEDDTTGVAPFVESMGEKMNYVVAIDDDKKTAETWVEASGEEGIPVSFVVEQTGKIAWIGHPVELEEVLDKVLAGTFDVEGERDRRATWNRLVNASVEHREKEEWGELLATLEGMGKADPDNKASYDFERCSVLLKAKKDYKAGYALVKELTEGPYASDANTLNGYAWALLDDEGIETRDFGLALTIAKKANRVSKGKDYAILDTLARAHFETGDPKKAAEVQSKSIKMAKAKVTAVRAQVPAERQEDVAQWGKEMVGELEAALARYEKDAEGRKQKPRQ